MPTFARRNHNAWLVEASRFADFLDLVYKHHWGEIWLYNNDLRVLRDAHLFQELYVERIGRRLSHNIDAVKLLLGDEAYRAFRPGNPDRKLASNLARLSTRRLATFYVGALQKAIPRVRPSMGKDDTLVFYTMFGELSADQGIVMLRHNRYPLVANSEPRIAVCWRLGDEKTLKERLGEPFQAIFENDENFRWIQRTKEHPFKFTLQEDISPVTKGLRHRRGKLPPSARPVWTTADVAIVVALQDEMGALRKLLPNSWAVEEMAGVFCVTVNRKGGGQYRVVLARAARIGSVHAAVTATHVIRLWNPRYVLLVGIAAGNRFFEGMQLGDVIAATQVHAYEYCKKVPGGDEPRPRIYECGNDLITAVEGLQDWDGSHIAAKRPPRSRLKRKSSCLHEGVVASGSKLVADTKFVRSLMRRTIAPLAGIEMEAEGVMVAALNHKPMPEVIVIKGVSDYADPRTRSRRNKDKWRKYAAGAAGSFAVDLLREGLIPLSDHGGT